MQCDTNQTSPSPCSRSPTNTQLNQELQYKSLTTRLPCPDKCQSHPFKLPSHVLQRLAGGVLRLFHHPKTQTKIRRDGQNQNILISSFGLGGGTHRPPRAVALPAPVLGPSRPPTPVARIGPGSESIRSPTPDCDVLGQKPDQSPAKMEHPQKTRYGVLLSSIEYY